LPHPNTGIDHVTAQGPPTVGDLQAMPYGKPDDTPISTQVSNFDTLRHTSGQAPHGRLWTSKHLGRVWGSNPKSPDAGQRLLPSFAHRSGLLFYTVQHTARVPVLWSCTCPGNYANSAPGLDLSFQCCHKLVHREDKSQPCEAELCWRHICLCPEICEAVHARRSCITAMTEMALQCHAAGYAPAGTRQVSQ
jgi:hypothetical protein